MKVRVRYFASIREALGEGELIEMHEGATVREVRDRLIASSPVQAIALARGKALRCALNQALSEESAVIAADAELAFFPPVTGG